MASDTRLLNAETLERWRAQYQHPHGTDEGRVIRLLDHIQALTEENERLTKGGTKCHKCGQSQSSARDQTAGRTHGHFSCSFRKRAQRAQASAAASAR